MCESWVKGKPFPPLAFMPNNTHKEAGAFVKDFFEKPIDKLGKIAYTKFSTQR